MTDFGSGKAIKNSDNDRTTTGLKGTVDYMSPETAKLRKRGDSYSYDPFASDMWSVGVTFYQLLTFELPFEGADA